ncbi:MAG: hypothetical protein ACK58L_19015, partial [Planctomycetota bacterium]
MTIRRTCECGLVALFLIALAGCGGSSTSATTSSASSASGPADAPAVSPANESDSAEGESTGLSVKTVSAEKTGRFDHAAGGATTSESKEAPK